MKRVIFIYSVFFAQAFCGDVVSEEYISLEEPVSIISGAYYGGGVTISRISHKNDATFNNDHIKLKKTNNQFDLSAICGFGAPFYRQYYAGIEFELFKRLNKKNCGDNRFSTTFLSNIGLNMDARFGRQLSNILVYITAGFSRIVGELKSASNKTTFGSFYPTVGIGIERKITDSCNVRADFRYAITSKDNNRTLRIDGNSWNCSAKPSKMSFRISMIRYI